MEAYKMDILGRIKQLKDMRGWSNYRLAKEAGMHEGSLNNLFRKNYQPTIPTLETICGGFGITLTQFFAQHHEAVVLSEEQREMLDIWDTLDNEQKSALLQLLKAIQPMI